MHITKDLPVRQDLNPIPMRRYITFLSPIFLFADFSPGSGECIGCSTLRQEEISGRRDKDLMPESVLTFVGVAALQINGCPTSPREMKRAPPTNIPITGHSSQTVDPLPSKNLQQEMADGCVFTTAWTLRFLMPAFIAVSAVAQED